MSLKIKFTNAGKSALVNPANIGTAAVDITEIRLGSANYDPTGTETDLQITIKSLNTFGGVTVADDVIHVTIRDDSSDTYTIGEIGLYSGTGVLMGIISSAATSIITQKGPNDILLISADAAVTEVDVTNLTFGPTDFIYPPATPTTQGVIEVADASEVQAGTPNKAVDAYELQQELTRRITSSLSDQSTTKMAAAKAVYDLNQAINQINTLLLSDTATLDTLQEIVDFIQLNRSDLDSLGIASIAGLQAALDGKLSTTGKASDSSKLNGATESTAATANTIAKRDSSGDILARLLKSTYAEQTSAPATSADICFRNSTTDNYHRFMNSSAFKTWCDLIGISVDGHEHSISNISGLQAALDLSPDLTNRAIVWSGSANSVTVSGFSSGLYLIKTNEFSAKTLIYIESGTSDTNYATVNFANKGVYGFKGVRLYRSGHNLTCLGIDGHTTYTVNIVQIEKVG